MTRNRDMVKHNLALVLISISATLFSLYLNPSGRLSDILGFYSLRFDDGSQTWPYSSFARGTIGEDWMPVEYPVITGIYMWLITFLIPESINSLVPLVVDSRYLSDVNWPYLYYFRITVLSFVFWIFISGKVLHNLRGRYSDSFLFLSPAVILAIPLNWDIICIALTLLAIRFFVLGKLMVSSIFLSLAVSTKFFPIVILISILAILLAKKTYSLIFRYLGTFMVSWLVVNLPVALNDFAGWSYFYRLSLERPTSGDGSIYQLFVYAGMGSLFIETSYYVLNVFGFIAVFILAKRLSDRQNLYFLSLMPIVVFVTLGKVVSIQFVLWITPIAIMSIASLGKAYRQRAIAFFVLWQAAEWIYNHAFYQMLVGRVTKSEMGYPLSEFLIWSSLRHSLLVVFFLYVLVMATKAPKLAQKKGKVRGES